MSFWFVFRDEEERGLDIRRGWSERFVFKGFVFKVLMFLKESIFVGVCFYFRVYFVGLVFSL